MSVDSALFKELMARFASGVTVVTTQYGDVPIGVTASAFASVSLEPPLLLVCFGKELFTHQVIVESGIFAVNILHAGQVDLAMRFAGMLPEYREDRFLHLETATAVTGCRLLPGVPGWADCRLWATYDGGDHSIFVGEVVAAGGRKVGDPLLYYHREWGQFAPLEVDGAEGTDEN